MKSSISNAAASESSESELDPPRDPSLGHIFDGEPQAEAGSKYPSTSQASASSSSEIINGKRPSLYEIEKCAQWSKRLKPVVSKTSYYKDKFNTFGNTGAAQAIVTTFERHNVQRVATIHEKTTLEQFYRKFDDAQRNQNVAQVDRVISFVIDKWKWTSWQCQSVFSIGDSRYRRLKSTLRLQDELLQKQIAESLELSRLSSSNSSLFDNPGSTTITVPVTGGNVTRIPSWTPHDQPDISVLPSKLFIDSFDEDNAIAMDGTNKHAPLSITCDQHCHLQLFIAFSLRCVDDSNEPFLQDVLGDDVLFRPSVNEWKRKEDALVDYRKYCRNIPTKTCLPLSRATFYRHISTSFDNLIRSNLNIPPA
jgi:hypothetical protein